MGFNATFNNISVISRRSVLLVEEAGVPGENHRPWAGNWQTLSRAMRVKRNPFLYGTNPGANSRRIGDRLQWSVQVSLNQLPRPLGHPGPKKGWGSLRPIFGPKIWLKNENSQISIILYFLYWIMSIKRKSNRFFNLISYTMVTWHIENALNVKILRNWLIWCNIWYYFVDFNIDRTKTSQPNFAQLKIYQVQMFG